MFECDRGLSALYWLVVLSITIGLWTFVLTLTGAQGDPHPFHFLPYPPGVAIAVVAGSTGSMLNGYSQSGMK